MAEGRDSLRQTALFYSHDGFGLGHLSRTLFLASELRARRPDLDIVVVTSSPAAHTMEALEDFAWVKLPSVTKTGVERYRPYQLSADLRQVIALRSALLLTTVQQMRPNLVIVDHRPLGLKGEAGEALEWVRHHLPATRIVVGLRDVVDEPETVTRDWTNQGIIEALERFYDHILVYGERSVLDLTGEYGMPETVRQKVHFTGYLGRCPVHLARAEIRASLGLTYERLVVVHTGGGGDGAGLIRTYLQIVDLLPEDVHSFIVTGPLLDREERRRVAQQAAGPRVTVAEHTQEMTSYVAASDLSVSMAGYNTVCEILAAGVPAVLVPRMFPRREQYIRASRLAERGLASMIVPADLTPASLLIAVVKRLTTPPRANPSIRLDGGREVASFLAGLLEASSTVAVPTTSGILQ